MLGKMAHLLMSTHRRGVRIPYLIFFKVLLEMLLGGASRRQVLVDSLMVEEIKMASLEISRYLVRLLRNAPCLCLQQILCCLAYDGLMRFLKTIPLRLRVVIGSSLLSERERWFESGKQLCKEI